MIGKTNIKATADPTRTRPVIKQDDVRHSKQQLHLLQVPILSLRKTVLYTDAKDRLAFYTTMDDD